MALLNQSLIDPNRHKTLIGVSTIDDTTLYPFTGIPLGSNTVFALTTAIVDASGNQITSFGGGTQYANGTSVLTPTGTVALGYDGTNVRALKTDSSGVLSVSGTVTASNPSVGSTGSAIPTSATLIGGSDGTNLQQLLVESASNRNLRTSLYNGANEATFNSTTTTSKFGLDTNILSILGTAPTTAGFLDIKGADGNVFVRQTTAANLNATVVGTGTFAVQAAQSGTWNITNISGTVSLPTNAAQETGGNLATLAGIVTSSRAAVNPISGQTGVAANTGAVSATTQRVVQANDAGKTFVSASGSASSSGNNTIVTAGTNRLKVYAFTLSTTSTTAVTVKFQSGASGTDLWSVILQAPSGVSTGANLAVTPPAWLFATASATLLNLNLSSANAVQWSVSYYDEA